MIAFAHCFGQYLRVVGIYVSSLTLLSSIHREVNGFAEICASSSSIEDIFSDIDDVTPESSFHQTLGLLSQDSLTKVKVVVSRNIRPWSWFGGERGGECVAVFRNFRYPANGERMCYGSLAIKIYPQVRLSFVIRCTPVHYGVSCSSPAEQWRMKLKGALTPRDWLSTEIVHCRSD